MQTFATEVGCTPNVYRKGNGLHKIYIVYYRQISVATKGLHKSAWFLCNTRFPLVVHKDEGIKTAI